MSDFQKKISREAHFQCLPNATKGRTMIRIARAFLALLELYAKGLGFTRRTWGPRATTGAPDPRRWNFMSAQISMPVLIVLNTAMGLAAGTTLEERMRSVWRGTLDCCVRCVTAVILKRQQRTTSVRSVQRWVPPCFLFYLPQSSWEVQSVTSYIFNSRSQWQPSATVTAKSKKSTPSSLKYCFHMFKLSPSRETWSVNGLWSLLPFLATSPSSPTLRKAPSP
eukprot:Rmarinus@m.7896